jgi:hypothetical protein
MLGRAAQTFIIANGVVAWRAVVSSRTGLSKTLPTLLCKKKYFQDKIGGILRSRIDKMQFRPVWLHRLLITQKRSGCNWCHHWIGFYIIQVNGMTRFPVDEI